MRRLRRRYGRSIFGDVDYVLMYGPRGTISRPYALKSMAIDEARALSRPNSFGGEVTVVERSGSHTREVGRARHGRYVAS